MPVEAARRFVGRQDNRKVRKAGCEDIMNKVRNRCLD